MTYLELLHRYLTEGYRVVDSENGMESLEDYIIKTEDSGEDFSEHGVYGTDIIPFKRAHIHPMDADGYIRTGEILAVLYRHECQICSLFGVVSGVREPGQICDECDYQLDKEQFEMEHR